MLRKKRVIIHGLTVLFTAMLVAMILREVDTIAIALQAWACGFQVNTSLSIET